MYLLRVSSLDYMEVHCAPNNDETAKFYITTQKIASFT